jgi:hypothetical protein
MSFNALGESLGTDAMRWLVLLPLVVIGIATLEGLVRTFWLRRAYDWRAFAASIADTLGRRAVDALGLTLAAALRLGWTGKLTGTALFFTPLVWLGFPPNAVLACVALNLLYQFWLHAPWIPRLGPLEWVLNTPTHHKVYHPSNTEYLDRNYGGVLIVFDRLFGTFADERADVPIRYGLTTPLRTHNPLRIAFHEWLNLGRDLWAERGWRAWLLTVFGPPGTRP